MLCNYGCGEIAKFQLKNGKWCCSKSQNSCPEIKKKTKGMKGKHHSKETKEKMSKSTKGSKHSKETKEKISKSRKGRKRKPFSEEWKRNMSEAQKGEKAHNYGKNFSEEHRKKISESIKKLWKDSNSIYHKEEYWIKIKKSIDVKPNKQEILLLELLNSLFPNKYKFVGDYSLWIGNKNPDFIDEERRKIIEFFGDWYHSKKFTGIENKDHENQRREYFEKLGYNTLIIWEHEFNNIEKLKRKLIIFNNIRLVKNNT